MSLEFTLNPAAPASAALDCIIVGAFADKSLSPAAQALDAASDGRLSQLAARGDISGKTGTTALLHDLPGVSAPRVLVVGLGEAARFGVAQYIKAVGDAARALKSGVVRSALLTLTDLPVKDRDEAWKIRQAVIAADHASYRYTATLGKKKPEDPGLAQLAIAGEDTTALAQGQAIAAGVEYARELGNLPPNLCTPAYLAESSVKFASEHEGAEAEILDEQQMQELGMGSLLAVARGSANRPRWSC
jgi:Leucyl aminopeptidase